MGSERICSKVSHASLSDKSKVLTIPQSSVHSELLNLRDTQKHARGTPFSPRSPTVPPSRILLSSSLSPSSPSESPKSIPTKDMTTLQEHTRQSVSKVCGQSRSSNNKNAAKISTSSGFTKAPKLSKNYTQSVSLPSSSQSSCSLSGQ
jgi:hypothetical protein